MAGHKNTGGTLTCTEWLLKAEKDKQLGSFCEAGDSKSCMGMYESLFCFSVLALWWMDGLCECALRHLGKVKTMGVLTAK